MPNDLATLIAEIRSHNLFREKNYIGGEWVSNTDTQFTVDTPIDGSVIGHVPITAEAGISNAFAHAEESLQLWKSKRADQRAKILHDWADLIDENIEILAQIVSLEQGKPISEARGEIAYGSGYFRWYSEEAKRLYGEIIPSHIDNSKLMVTRHPLGVVAAIIPWNFPSALVARKSAAALAAGCTVVLKPSEGTPFSALAMARLAELAGIPGGVFSVVTADAEEFSSIAFRTKSVRKLTFTGSTRVGSELVKGSALNNTRLSLELGGHAPCIVFADCNLDTAVNGAVGAKFMSTGEDCLAINRIFVEAEIYDEFCEKYAQKVSKLRLGNPFDEQSELGPLYNNATVAKCKLHIDDAVAKGAKITLGGGLANLGGLFHEPTVLVDVTSDMLIYSDETFGPVAPIIKFNSESEVIEMANDSDYGLASYFFTENIHRSWRVSEALDYSMIALNTPSMTGPPVPFGGIKRSGQGREGGHQGLEDFTEIKYFCIGGLDNAHAN